MLQCLKEIAVQFPLESFDNPFRVDLNYYPLKQYLLADGRSYAEFSVKYATLWCLVVLICWRYGIQCCLQDSFWVGVEIEGSNPRQCYQGCPPFPNFEPFSTLLPVWIAGHVREDGQLPIIRFSFETEVESETHAAHQDGQAIYWRDPERSLRSFNSWYMNSPEVDVVEGKIFHTISLSTIVLIISFLRVQASLPGRVPHFTWK